MSESKKECIIVLGMHRSGTSALTGLLSILGGDVGSDIMPPTEDNPKGYFENNYIYHLNRKILREHEADWDTANFDFTVISRSKREAYIEEAKTVLTNEFRYIQRIIVKDPRVCLLFPIWEKALLDLNIQLTIILPIRSPIEVARSLQKRNDFSIEQGVQLWASHVFLAEKYSRPYSREHIFYPQEYSNIDALIDKLSAIINVTPSQEIVLRAKCFYSPSLTHHSIGFENISNLPEPLTKLLLILQSKEFSETAFDEAREQYLAERAFYAQPYQRKQVEEETIYLQDKQALANQNSTLQNELNALVKSNSNLKETLQSLTESKQNLQNEYRVLSEKNQSTLAANQQAFEEKDTFITRLKSDINKLLEKIDSIEGKYHQLREDRDSKATQIAEQRVLNYRLKNSDELINHLSTQPKQSKRLIQHLNHQRLSGIYQKKWYWPVERKPLATQRKRLIADSGLFSPIYYLTSYPDVRKSGIAPLEHFYKYGWKENRRPSEGFDLKGYLIAYPDVAQSGMNPLIHYLIHGKKEGRSPTPKVQSTRQNPRPRSPSKSITSKSDSHTYATKSGSVSLSSDQQISYGPIISRDWQNKISLIAALGESDIDPTSLIADSVIRDLQEKLKTDKQPLVSIVMPSWNRGDVIQHAIDSVLQQSYPNIELIVSDDGSTDNTLTNIETHYAHEIASKKIKLIKNQHRGVCPTRNAGLQAATGELIAYLDSDNQWREHYLLLMVAAFAENDELNCAYSALLLHDNNKQSKRILSSPYNRKQLLTSNFIDLNVFVHRASLYQQFGGFDETLTRLVDWELIIRYSRLYEPAHLPFIGVDYYLDHDKFNNITTTVGLDDNRDNIYKKHFSERVRYGLESIRLAYVLWDFPALSQTFVINELRWLVANHYDVIVYYAVDPDRAASLDFEVKAYQTKTPEELIPLFREHNRNYCHSHFAYPAVTKLTWPACSALKIPFSFMPHAVDIFHHENQKRNHVGEIAESPLCKKVFVHGPYHKNFLENQGVPSEKMAFNFQAVNLDEFLSPLDATPAAEENSSTSAEKIHKGIVLSRFVEKKGISTLIDAAALLKSEPVCFELYGYGPLESDYRDQIEQLKLTNIRLMGALESKEEVRDLYANSDFLIAPCIEADNGDRDGFPTVILEAFSMGMPVITTDIAAVPDYLTDEVQALIAPAADAKALANKVKQLIRMPANRQQALTRQAQHFLHTKVGTHLSMSLLTDEWLDKRIDIFLVSFNNEQYDDEAETLEIIRRIFAFTTTPFTLTIVDNHSDDSFWQNILAQVEGRDNVRLIRKDQNLMCGPSSNIALEMGDGEFAIYLCAKEGFVAQHGWERTLLNSMRAHPDAALGGHHAHMPKYVYGHEYEKHPDFSKYRNQDFLTGRLDKAFTHIQGGVFIIRREVFIKHGGFNPLIPHGGMDVELSFYYESLGYRLLEIPEVASLTVKTRPTLTAMMDENTVVAHPLTIETARKQLDAFVAKTTKQCNACGWQGKSFSKALHCPKCESTPEGRLVYQYIASDYRIYRKGNALLLGKDEGLANALKPLFLLQTASDPNAVLTTENNICFSCIIVIPNALQPIQNLPKLCSMLDDGGILIVVDDETNNPKNQLPAPTHYTRRSTASEYTWKRLSITKNRSGRS